MKTSKSESKNEMFYAVVYCKDGTIHLWPAKTQGECEDKLVKILQDPRCKARTDRTTIMKRDISFAKNGYIFGSSEKFNFAKDEKDI